MKPENDEETGNEQTVEEFKDLLDYLDITNIEIKKGPEEMETDELAQVVSQSLDTVERVLDEQLKRSSESSSNGNGSSGYEICSSEGSCG